MNVNELFKNYNKIFDILKIDQNCQEIPPVLGIDSLANNSKIK